MTHGSTELGHAMLTYRRAVRNDIAKCYGKRNAVATAGSKIGGAKFRLLAKAIIFQIQFPGL
jgi:hypothetical protein